MKILLLGEASNLHWTLSEGLRSLGHKVTVISNGSVWMNPTVSDVRCGPSSWRTA